MHTQRLTLTLTALASAGLLLTACGTESGAGSEGGSGGRSVASEVPLTGVRWNVESVTAGGKRYAAPDGAHLTIGKEGEVRGNLGCNDVTAKAEAKDGRLTFGAPATTRKLCAGAAMSTERRLLKLFDGTARYALERETLKLTTADGTVIQAYAGREK